MALGLPASVTAGVSSNAAAPAVQAASQGDWMCGFGTGVQAGTQGFGINLSYNIVPSFYLKLEGNYFRYNRSFNISDIDYEGNVDLSNVGLTGNYLPFEGSGFRVTAGAFFSHNEITGSTKGAGQQVNVNGTTYTLQPADSIEETAKWNACDPYLGVGWDWAFGEKQNLVLGLDLGVSYIGSPSTSVTGTGRFATNPVAMADLVAEQANVQDDLSRYKFYPVVKVSFTYRF